MSIRDWSRLNKQQIGRYAEYLVKMEFSLEGCSVFGAEVDDRGIDFVVRLARGRHFDVQVKSCRYSANTPYIFLQKTKFEIHKSSLLALVVFFLEKEPSIFLIPSRVGDNFNPIFESRDYGADKVSPPEWGLTLSKRKLAALNETCNFQTTLRGLTTEQS